MDKDKIEEMCRFDARAQSQLSESDQSPAVLGSDTMADYLRAPYIFYETCVNELMDPQDQVLELGAGNGLHTLVLVQTAADVTVSDISLNSLKLLEQRIINSGGNVKTQVADIETLSFEDNTFDVIACAGSLSYGEPKFVDNEIRRVLRPGGTFICVDSLNHNPIYRFNRWLHYLRGNRTYSTLQRMPDLGRIESLSVGYESVTIKYFGSIVFLMPILVRLFSQEKTRTISDFVDRLVGVKRSAFKFVLVARNLIKEG